MGGHFVAPEDATRNRGAPRLRRGATNAGGYGGPFRGPRGRNAKSRSATASPGRDERWGVWGAISWPLMSMSPKRRHDLRREALELLENHRLGRADRLADVDDLQARILFLDVFQLLGDLLRRAGEPRAGLD